MVLMIGRFKTKNVGYIIFFFILFFSVVVGRADAKETTTSSVVVSVPVATTEDDNEDDATINKWSKFRVKALKFNQSTYFGYIVLAIIFIGSIALVLVRETTYTSILNLTSIVIENGNSIRFQRNSKRTK